tara:strand:- start:7 stop:513 length:507 start_codon:yes stop_codon:yes gene_type:complete
MEPYKFQVDQTISFIKAHTPSLDDTTARCYTRMLHKLFQRYGEKGFDMNMALDRMPACFLLAVDILSKVDSFNWTDTSKRNNIMLMLTMVRAYLGEAAYEQSEIYKIYESAFTKVGEKDSESEYEPSSSDSEPEPDLGPDKVRCSHCARVVHKSGLARHMKTMICRSA